MRKILYLLLAVMVTSLTFSGCKEPRVYTPPLGSDVSVYLNKKPATVTVAPMMLSARGLGYDSSAGILARLRFGLQKRPCT